MQQLQNASVDSADHPPWGHFSISYVYLLVFRGQLTS